jgi:hypothetical protein
VKIDCVLGIDAVHRLDLEIQQRTLRAEGHAGQRRIAPDAAQRASERGVGESGVVSSRKIVKSRVEEK